MRNLYLEVAESILIDAAAAAVRRLRELKDLGVHIVMDDFGVAYPSLSLSQALPAEPGEDRPLADGAVRRGTRGHGYRGRPRVETVDQLALLRELVGGLAQSLYFSRPVTGGEASALPDAVSLL